MPFKIAYVIGQLSIGGTERQLLELVRGLNRARFEPLVVSLYGNAPLKAAFEKVDCPVYLLEREKRGRLATTLQLYRLFRSHRPHLVHAFAYASRAAIPAARLLGNVKVIVSLRTDPEWQVTSVDKMINALADVITSNSHAAAEKIAHSWPRLLHYLIYNGIDLFAFDATKNSHHRPFSVNNKILGVVARLAPVKGLEMLLEAFAQIHGKIPNAHLWLIGDGPLRNYLETKAREMGLADNVVFWGIRDDIPALLAQCDIGVLSSHWEGLPNAILEYMAAELPVVATRVGGVPEVVIDGETGLLVPPGNPQALADALLSLLSDTELARRMGQAGRRRVEQYFTLERMVKENEKLYLELLEEDER